jgi:hypothetical protein
MIRQAIVGTEIATMGTTKSGGNSVAQLCAIHTYLISVINLGIASF